MLLYLNYWWDPILDWSWDRPKFSIMVLLVWSLNHASQPTLLQQRQQRMQGQFCPMTQTWGSHFGLLQKVPEKESSAYGKQLMSLRYTTQLVSCLPSSKGSWPHRISQISEEEIEFLTDGEDPYDDAVVRKLYHPNLKLLLVTEGAEGCRYYTKVRTHIWCGDYFFWSCLSVLKIGILCCRISMEEWKGWR